MAEIGVMLREHGYVLLALIVFLEACGIPVPAALALAAAGAAAARHLMRPELIVGIAVPALLLGDTLLYVLGRYTGWKLLGVLCRIALNPESCILSSAESFYRHGKTTLMFAKFIPGVNTLAPPLAGSMRMRVGLFWRLDLVAACMYVLGYFGLGFVFGDLIIKFGGRLHTFQRSIEWVVLPGLVAYLIYRFFVYWKHRAYRVVPRVQVDELARILAEGDWSKAMVADVRSHGYYDPGALRIKGSVRMEPNKLLREIREWPKDKAIYLYCT